MRLSGTLSYLGHQSLIPWPFATKWVRATKEGYPAVSEGALPD